MSPKSVGIDSNILVYAFDSTEAEKHRKAENLVTELCESGKALLSTQNLTEFFFVATEGIENPMNPEEAAETVEDFRNSPAEIASIEPEHAVRASRKMDESGDFWDLLLCATLKDNGVRKIYTENIDDFQDIPGIEAENPFE